MHQRDHRRRHRRHLPCARRARLIRRRRRHCAAPVSTTSGERVGLSGLLGRSRRFLLLLARRLIRLRRLLPLPACGERVGVRGLLRRLRRGYGRRRRLGAVLDHGAVVLAGERILPLEGVEPPAHRRDRQPVVGHERVRGPGRVAPRVERARHPFAPAALVALGHFELGHQRRHALPWRGRVRRQRRTRGGELLRVERGARDRERGFGVGRPLGRERLDATQALARGIARPQLRVGGGEIGMGIGAPRPLDDARGPAPFAQLAEEPPGERRRRHEVGRELGRLARERDRALAVALHRGLRLRGDEHRALAAIGALVDEAASHVALEPVERAAPVAGGAAKLERRLPGPHRHRGVLGRLLGIAERGGVVVAALRLHEQAVQAEHAGVVAVRHLLEGRDRRVAIARELRGLGAQQQGERLARRDARGLGGEFLGGARVAGADGDQPPRYRAISAHAAPDAQVARDVIWRAQDRAQDRPRNHARRRDCRDRRDEHHDRGVDAPALPGDGDVARPLGEPHRAEREQRDDDEINEEADYCGLRFGWALLGLTNFFRDLGALPPPACGEGVGVRGTFETRSPRKTPLTRIASRSDLSPQAGRGGARGSCVQSHHLLSPESASAARRRLASMAAVRACALLIQASAGARASGGSCASSAAAPARSPREALASLRATIAAPSLPGASSTRRMRTSFSALSCSRPSTPSRSGAREAGSSAGASAESCRASVAAAGTPARANGSSAATSFGSAPSAFAVASSAAKASPRSTAALSAVAASASRTARSSRAAAFSLCSTAARRLASASNSLRSTAAGGFCASSEISAAPASARTRASRPTASASSLRRLRTPTASAIAFTSVWSAATRAASAGSLALPGGPAAAASSLATRPATSSSAFGSAAGGGAREARSRSSSSTPATRASSALTPLSRLRNRLTSPSTASTRPPPATAAPSPDTCRRGASGGALAGTSGGSGLDGWSLEGVAGEASMRALLSPCRGAARCWGSRLMLPTDTRSRAVARRCRSRLPAANLCAVWPMTNVAFGQENAAFGPRRLGFGQIPARQTRCTPLPLVGRGWGWGSLFGATSALHRITPLLPPLPQPAAGLPASGNF